MGEMLPFMLARVDDNLPPKVTGLDRLPSEYILDNVHITTSGLFTMPPLLCALMVFGAERVLFSVDWPYAPNERRPAPAGHRAAEPRRPRAARARQRRAAAAALPR